MKKRLIIFDMDGTLINSGNVITNTINFVRKNLNLDKIPKDIMLRNLNNPDINSSEFFYGTSEFTSTQTKLFREYYDKNCTKDIILYDGIYDLLNELKAKNYTLSVATNASVEFATQMLKSLGIGKFFSYVVGSNMVQNHKPAPDMLEKTLKYLNFNIANTILVGDSQKDKRAAQAIDMNCLLVNWGFTNHKDAITNIDELRKEIKKL
jgi:phosphoglycolate phosphatase